jgi:hypothetical protein
MPVTNRPLSAPYALAAGKTIQETVSHRTEPLPEQLQSDYQSWLASQTSLQAKPISDDAKLRPFDAAVDRFSTLPAKFADLLIESYSAATAPLSDQQKSRLDDARSLRAIFPADLREITSLKWIVEWSTVSSLIQSLTADPKLRAIIERFGLNQEVDLLVASHKLFGDRLGLTSTGSSSDQEQLVASWNERFTTLLVSATYWDRQFPGILGVFDGPYQEQLHNQLFAAAQDRKPKTKPVAS